MGPALSPLSLSSQEAVYCVRSLSRHRAQCVSLWERLLACSSMKWKVLKMSDTISSPREQLPVDFPICALDASPIRMRARSGLPCSQLVRLGSCHKETQSQRLFIYVPFYPSRIDFVTCHKLTLYF